MTRALDGGFYSTKEAAQIAKVPKSTLYYWLRTDLFAPKDKQRGPRVLSFSDLRDIVVAQKLRNQGARIPHVRRALEWVRHEHDVQRLAEANFQVGDGGLQFLTKGRELIAPHKGNQKVFVIHMAEVFRQLGYSDDLTTIRPHDRISIDPKVRGGSPVIQGTRIPAHLIARLATEEPVESVLDLYPSLTRDDVDAALEWAASVA